jgi:hypothetical protein
LSRGGSKKYTAKAVLRLCKKVEIKKGKRQFLGFVFKIKNIAIFKEK